MKRRARTNCESVYLSGIPSWSQGHQDKLCVYYSGAMLIAALRPDLQDAFGGKIKDDPIFSNVQLHGTETREQSFVKWFESGKPLDGLCHALDKACLENKNRHGAPSVSTHFEYRERNLGDKYDGLIEEIIADLSQGFPSILSWNGEGIGNHAVMVSGHLRYSGPSGSTWLILEDPSGDSEIEVEQLTRLKKGTLSHIRVVSHDGVRPDKHRVSRDQDGDVIARTAERWSRATAKWEPM